VRRRLTATIHIRCSTLGLFVLVGSIDAIVWTPVESGVGERLHQSSHLLRDGAAIPVEMEVVVCRGRVSRK
jgi:hypothetical protein